MAYHAVNDEEDFEEVYNFHDDDKGKVCSMTLGGGKLDLKHMGPTICDQMFHYHLTTGKKKYPRSLALIGELMRKFKQSNWDFKSTFQKKLKCHPEGHPLKDAPGSLT